MQQLGRLSLIVVRPRERLSNQLVLQLAKLKAARRKCHFDRVRTRDRLVNSPKNNVIRPQLLTPAQQNGALQDITQLTHIPRPSVPVELLVSLVINLSDGLAKLFGESGHKVLRELKRDKELSRIPVLIVTAHAKTDLGKDQLADLIEDAALEGPGLYLEKPVSPLSYIRCVQRALGLEESEEAADKISLKEELEQRVKGADPEALRRALAALDKE